MGWFLEKKSNKPTKVRRQAISKQAVAKAKSQTQPRSWYSIKSVFTLKLLSIITILTLTGVSWHFAEKSLRQYVRTHRNAPVSTQQVNLVEAPAWISHYLQEDLKLLVLNQISSDPINFARLDDARLSLAASPWVKQVSRIARGPHGQIDVWAKYRQPVAVVQAAGGYYLIDRDRIRLPGLYLKHQISHLQLPLIVGTAQVPNRAGERWPGHDLQSGVALIQLLADAPYLDQIYAIDVSKQDKVGRTRLMIYTKQGGVVRWGLPPGEEYPIEPDAITKKQWLAGVYHQRGSIDAGGKIVDIYGAAVFVRQ